MRVVLFTDADVFAGTERHIFDLGRGLREEGVDVAIACPSPAPLAEKAAGHHIPVVPIQKQGLVDWTAIRTLRRLLKSGRFDLIHAHNGRTALAAAIAVRLARRGRCVVTQHFLEPDHVTRKGPKAALSNHAHHWVSRSTHRFIAISQAARDAMISRGDAPADKIMVIPNGIVAPDLKSLTTPASLRKELGIPTGAPLIVCAARLEPEKDIGNLITAMHFINAHHPEAVCVVAGEGSQKQQLRELIRRKGLRGTVKLPGFRNDVLSLINAGDLFVLPSRAEPFGLVLLEAMALGKPVIATRAGGPPEIVVEGETGLLVPPGNPEALAQSIQSLLENPATARQMGQKGQQRFQEKYTAQRMAAATLQAYQRD